MKENNTKYKKISYQCNINDFKINVNLAHEAYCIKIINFIIFFSYFPISFKIVNY